MEHSIPTDIYVGTDALPNLIASNGPYNIVQWVMDINLNLHLHRNCYEKLVNRNRDGEVMASRVGQGQGDQKKNTSEPRQSVMME